MAKRKVLIPLDGSEFSRQIVRVVRTFFDPSDVQLVLFRAAYSSAAVQEVKPHDAFAGAAPVSGSYESYSRALDTEYATVERERDAVRTELLSAMQQDVEELEHAGYIVKAEVHFGEPAQRIIDYVNNERIDLVAMTTHGRTGLGRLVLGSVAERVVRGVAVPVLLMRNVLGADTGPVLGELRSLAIGSGRQLTICVATDGSTLAHQAVSKAGALAEMLQAKLSLLVMAGESNDAAQGQRLMEDARQLVAQVRPRVDVVPLVGYPDEVVLDYLAKHPVDLLCIGAFQDRGAGSTTAIGPTAQRIIQYAPASVLMYKGHRESVNSILACVAVDDTLVVDVAAQLADLLEAKLTLLHVIPPSAASYLSSTARVDAETPSVIPLAEVLAQGTPLANLLKGWIAELDAHHMNQDVLEVQRGNTPEAILKAAHDGSYDLIVVGSRSGPGHFLSSVANAVVRYAEQSVLVLRARAS